jgi:hypothetical protein
VRGKPAGGGGLVAGSASSFAVMGLTLPIGFVGVAAAAADDDDDDVVAGVEVAAAACLASAAGDGDDGRGNVCACVYVSLLAKEKHDRSI